MFLCSNPQQVEPEGSAQTLGPGRLLSVAGPLGQATEDGAETLQDPWPLTNVTNV